MNEPQRHRLIPMGLYTTNVRRILLKYIANKDGLEVPYGSVMPESMNVEQVNKITCHSTRKWFVHNEFMKVLAQGADDTHVRVLAARLRWNKDDLATLLWEWCDC